MCVKFAINTSKTALANLYNHPIDEFRAQKEGLPYKKHLVLTNNGFKNMIWGDSSQKIIHKRIIDIEKLEKGILPITGFYIWKKEKAYAPIGFGEHKELIKIFQKFVSIKNKPIIHIPILWHLKNNQYQFYILVDNSKPIIKPYQPNEPLVVTNFNNWINNQPEKLFHFTEFDYLIS